MELLLLELRVLVPPDTLPARTLKMLNRSVASLKKGRVSPPIELSFYQKSRASRCHFKSAWEASIKRNRSYLNGLAGVIRKSAFTFLFLADESVDHRADDGTKDRRDPEEPELLQRPAVGKDGGGRAARWVEGEIGDRNPGPIDQGHGQADG